MTMQPPVEVTVDARDLARVLKRLEKWSDRPLKARLRKAIEGGAKLLVNPIRRATPVRSGRLRKGVKTRSQRRRSGEVAAFTVGPTSPYRHLVIRGHRMVSHAGRVVGRVEGDPFVDRAVNPLVPAVRRFLDEQVRKL